jgi:hypothetical protein
MPDYPQGSGHGRGWQRLFKLVAGVLTPTSTLVSPGRAGRRPWYSSLRQEAGDGFRNHSPLI